MRNAFARVMTELAGTRDDICLLSGDIGNRMFDQYKEIAPKRFINCGIAEANMMSMAAGIAQTGMRPVIYTITPFTTIRCLEQIKIGAAYHGKPVVIVGTGSGLSYSELGATHHSLDDIGLMRNIPNMNICAPADSNELEAQLKDALKAADSTYIRIGKKGEPVLTPPGEGGIGKNITLKNGNRLMVIGIGPIMSEAIKTADTLEKEGINIDVSLMGSIRPIDEKFLLSKVNNGITKWISYEEHCASGGLGSELLEWINDNGMAINLNRLGTKIGFIHELGNQAYTRDKQGIVERDLLKLIRDNWN